MGLSINKDEAFIPLGLKWDMYFTSGSRRKTQTLSKEPAQKTEGALLMSTGYSHNLAPREIQKHRKKSEVNC